MIDYREIAQYIVTKERENAEAYGDKLPDNTVDGKYMFQEDGFWTGGFWTGILYKCYLMSQDTFFLEAAKKSRHRFINRLKTNMGSLGHDVGFFYSLSTVADYLLTGDEEAKEVSIEAAGVLMRRFNEKGKFIQAWDVWEPGEAFSEENRGRIIIDCMYNLPILFWASEITGDARYAEVARAHADTCQRWIVREDDTTYHTFVFDPETGEPKGGKTFQGYADESCWARGQTWALGGFAHAYRYTGKIEYLETAKKCAEVYISNLEEDWVPMWDFSLESKEGEPRDTSAASCAAAGLLEIALHCEGKEKERYESIAENIIQSLYKNYSAKDSAEEEGLILHACNHRPHNSGIDCSNIYGDYYFCEAVARLMKVDKSFW